MKITDEQRTNALGVLHDLILYGSAAVVALVLLFGIGLGGRYLAMRVERWFGPREQSIQREIFRETRSYDEGKLQELVRYRLQHARADSDVERAAIESAVRHAFAEYDASRLPPELRNFVHQCQ